MKKSEIKNITNGILIAEMIETYSSMYFGVNCNTGWKSKEKHFMDLKAEAIKRGLMSEEDFKYLCWFA